jgi:hypothetical protein
MLKADSDRFSEVDTLLPYQTSDVLLRLLLKVLRRMSDTGLLDDIRAKYLLDTFDEFDLGRASQEQVQCAAVLALQAGKRVSWPIAVSNNALSAEAEELTSVLGIQMVECIVRTFCFVEKGVDPNSIESVDWFSLPIWQGLSTCAWPSNTWHRKDVTKFWLAKWGNAYDCADMCVAVARLARGRYRSDPWIEEAKQQVIDLFSIPGIKVV